MATQVRLSPQGVLLELGSYVTGHSMGVCVGGSLFGGYDATASVCYMSTPTFGEAGFTVTVGGGGGAPYGANALIGFSVSNAQTQADFGGTSAYLGVSAGEAHKSAGVTGSVSRDESGCVTWQATAGWAPGLRSPAPFSFGGGVARTWTLGWW